MKFRLSAVLALALVACAPDSPPAVNQAPAPTAVRLAPVLREARAQPIVATGVLSSKAERKASFKLGGIIAAITVDEGDVVKRGQVVAVLRATEVEAAVEQATQGVAKAERDLARAKTLFEGNAATREQLDDATTAAAIARSQLRAARFNQDNAVIRAASDGRVLRRLAEPNELVGPGQPVLILSGDSAGWVMRVALADRDVVQISDTTAAEVELSAWPGLRLPGTITEIASAATSVGTYEIEVSVPPPATGAGAGSAPVLRSGMIGRARLRPATTQVVALVPALAVRDGDGRRATVWSPAAGGGVVAHQVEVAYFLDDLVAISRGLDGVEQVISEGAAYLNERSKIEVAAPAAARADVPAPPGGGSAAAGGGGRLGGQP